MESAIFPLDEELELLPGRYTPQIQATMTRLGSKMPFEQAAEEVWLNQRSRVKEAALRGTTYRHGAAAEAIERAEVERLEREAPASTATPKQLLISTDGAFIHLTDGEWREVKSLVVGEFESRWNQKKGEVEVKTSDITYFSRSYQIREFERYALAELHRRGMDNAKRLVTVNDGSEWIQSFADYHIPQAIRILDFNHALDYIADGGRIAWGEGTERFKQWFSRMASQLKHKPPQQTLAELAFLYPQLESDEQIAALDHAIRYLQKRLDFIDYPHFQSQGLPIGSGSVESGHKVVVHSRMKQAGMRWAEAHVDPMLALRNLVCNGRWEQGWAQIIAYHWQQHHQDLREQAGRQRPPASLPITFASVKVAAASTTADDPPSPPVKRKQPHRPAPDHPWRHDIWPTKESWRWN